MKRNRKVNAVSVVAVCLVAWMAAFGASGDKTKANGMIISRTGETLILNSSDGKVTIVLDDSTKVQQPLGVFRKKQMSAAVLIPGLKVRVDGTTDDQNRIVARSITFNANDLQTAEMIQAGLHPTAQQVAANQQNIEANKQNIRANQQGIVTNAGAIEKNQQNIETNKQQIEENIKDIETNADRFTQLSEYDVKGETIVTFPIGSSKISADGESKLSQLAQRAASLTGYIIEVKGYADSSGNATMNQRLSEERAQEVVAYLIQNCGVPIRHVVAPGAMGIAQPVASNETAAGRAENRRVEVKVLLNKGIAGK